MYEFFQVVDAMHDDPTIFPVLSDPHSPHPFEWEATDGDTPAIFTTKRVAVMQHTRDGWTKLRSFSDLKFTVVITDARLVVYCQKFTKGGGWWGFGAGGLAIAAVANVVSHARAAARRKGKVLLAQVRYPWLMQVSAPADKRGRRRTLRLVVDAGSGIEHRMLALDLEIGERAQPANYAALIAVQAAGARLAAAPLSAADEQACRALADGAEADGEPHWDVPAAVPVGAPGSIPQFDSEPGRQPQPDDGEPDAFGQGAAQPQPDGGATDALPAAAAQASDTAGVTDGRCPACGHTAPGGARACGRCGQPLSQTPQTSTVVAAAATELRPDIDATTNRSALPGQPPGADEAPTLLHSRPPAPPALPVSSGLPLEVLLVSVGMVVVAGFLLYPVLRYGFPLLPHLADSNDLVRAFAALVLYVFVMLGGAGVALLLLAVGLWRASRVCQVLTWLLCAVLAIAALAAHDAGAAGLGGGAKAAIVSGSALVALLLALPGAQRHFIRGAEQPVGVDLAVAVSRYFGTCAVLGGLTLMVAGTVAAKFVGWGLALAAGGGALLVVSRPLRAGRSGARVAASVLYLGYVIICFVIADQTGDASSMSALIPCGVAVAAVAGLWLSDSSQRHFAQPRALPPLPPVAAVSSVVVLVAAVALTAVGLHAAGSHRKPAAYFPAAADTYSVAASPPSYAPASPSAELDEEQASRTATEAFDAMSGNGSVNTCDGSAPPSMAISDYTIDDISPDTSGGFAVSAGVTLEDGTTETVTVDIDTDVNEQPCLQTDNVDVENVQSAAPATPAAPSDVPSVPSSGDPVPTDAPLPDAPQDPSVVAYTDSGATPTDAAQLVEYQPDGLTGDEAAAIADVITFMTRINQQRFAAAWDVSTERLTATSPSSTFRHGYRTSRFYQVAFGQPEDLADDLIAIPARFVSRQDPAAQGDPPGVTDCSYWPQYVFVVTNVDGRWLDDVAGKYAGRSELDGLKRVGADGASYVNPVSQRVSC